MKIRLYDIETARDIEKAVNAHNENIDPDCDIELYGLPENLFNDDWYDFIRYDYNSMVIYDNDEGRTWYVPLYFVKSITEEI